MGGSIWTGGMTVQLTVSNAGAAALNGWAPGHSGSLTALAIV